MSKFKAGQIVNLVGIIADAEVLQEPDFGYEQEEFSIMRVVELCELPVTIKSEETDNYWNIQIGTRTIYALSEVYFSPVD